MKRIWFGLVLIYVLTGCSAPVKDAILQPSARDILSPEELPDSLRDEPIYWQNHLIYLSGQPFMENDPVRQLWNEMNIVSAPIPAFSNNKRYMLYRPAFGAKILLWDLETGERKWLAEAGKNLPASAMIGGIAFMPDDDKVIFSYTWDGENQETSSDLALVDIATGEVESLHIAGFVSDFFEISVSPDGKWAATSTVTLNNRVCFLVNLIAREVKCLDGEEGWHISVKFLPDSEHVVYSHQKEINSPTTIMLSRIDGTENRVLVTGLLHLAWIQVVSAKEIVFVGGTYDNPPCSHVYIINQDGSDLRRLAYLGEDCIADEGTAGP
jgi:Tol biopolymer transport system component